MEDKIEGKFGIYGIYTFYKLMKDLNKICEGDGKESPNCIIVLLLTMRKNYQFTARAGTYGFACAAGCSGSGNF